MIIIFLQPIGMSQEDSLVVKKVMKLNLLEEQGLLHYMQKVGAKVDFSVAGNDNEYKFNEVKNKESKKLYFYR